MPERESASRKQTTSLTVFLFLPLQVDNGAGPNGVRHTFGPSSTHRHHHRCGYKRAITVAAHTSACLDFVSGFGFVRHNSCVYTKPCSCCMFEPDHVYCRTCAGCCCCRHKAGLLHLCCLCICSLLSSRSDANTSLNLATN